MLAEYGIPSWAEWIFIAAIILLGTLAAAVIIRFLLSTVARRIAEWMANELDDILVRTLSRTLFNRVLIDR